MQSLSLAGPPGLVSLASRSGSAFQTFPRTLLSRFVRPRTGAYGRISLVLRHIGRVSPRRATSFFVVRQRRRQESVPRCRAPFGGSLLPAMPGGVFANSPCGLKHAKPFFRPSSPPVGTSEGTGNAGDQRSVAVSASGEARWSSVSPSEPPSSGATGGEVRRSCLSPKGEFCAGRPLRAAQGSRTQADR